VAEVDQLVQFVDTVYLPNRPSGAKEGVLSPSSRIRS
jgi:hypothetical protein